MAEKTVSVRLKAVIDDYQKAMKAAGDSTVTAAGKADAFKKLGQSTADLGDRLTRNVTLPIIGVGVAATKMSMDFDKTFVNMQSLAGVAGDEIEKMKSQVLDLAGETGKAPQELAEALYFLRSSGLDASEAMSALEVSAKGSAAGLGSTVQVADAVSSAMNAYAKSGLTAAEATDVMVATAREGKAEPAELAAQMGRLLPISSELGITFNDVGAALATLSLSGNDAAASSTLLGNIMSKLLKPSEQGAEALAEVGIGLDDIRSMIADEGLLGTLEMLRESLGDAGFTKFFEDAQAVQGALAITGGDIEATRALFANLNDSVGATDEAFSTWAESMGAKNAKAWAQFQAAMIKLGDTLAPLATDLIGFASAALEWFEKLPDPVKKFAAILVIAAAAAGPLLSTFGRLTTLASGGMKLGSKFLDWASGMNSFGDALNSGAGAADGLSRKMGGLQKAAGLAAGVAGIGAVLFAIHEIGQARKQAQIDKLVDDFMATGEAGDVLTEALEGNKFAMGDFAKTFSQLLDTNLAAAERWVDAAEAAGMQAEWVEKARAAIEDKGKAEAQAAVDADANTEAVEELTVAFDEETTSVNQTIEALAALSDALTAQFDPLFGMLDAQNGVRDARLGVEEATRKLSEAEKEHGKDSEEAAAASRDLTDAHDEAVTAALGLEQAQIALASAVENGDVKVDEARVMLQKWVEQGHVTQAEADVMAARFDVYAASVAGVTEELNAVPPTTSTDVRIRTAEARVGVRTVNADLDALDRRSATVDVYLNVHGKSATELLAGYGVSSGSGRGSFQPRASGGPLVAGQAYLFGEHGPEIGVFPSDGYMFDASTSSAMMSGSMTSGGSMGSLGGTYIDNRSYTISTGADPQKVVEALKRYEHTNGPVPVTVRGR